MSPLRWIDRRLIVVEGKGGVGRTTVTAALGLAAARLGKRVCVAELHGEGALAHRLGLDRPQYAPRAVAPGVDVMSLSAGSCLADFGQRKLHLGPLAGWLFESRLMTSFVEAVPGLQDVVQLGKVEDRLLHPLSHEPPYDLLVIDGPATGHGLTLLSSARSMRQMTRVGPFHDLALLIEQLLDDRHLTATMVVTLPEALPVAETLELLAALAAQGARPDGVIVNQLQPATLPAEASLGALDVALPTTPTGNALRALARDALASTARQDAAMAALRSGTSADLTTLTLPRLIDPGAGCGALEPLVSALVAAVEAG